MVEGMWCVVSFEWIDVMLRLLWVMSLCRCRRGVLLMFLMVFYLVWVCMSRLR